MTEKLDRAIYEGAHLASMFAYPAVSGGSCHTKLDTKQAAKYLAQYILSFTSGKPEQRFEEALEVLETLETLGPYLRAIAKEMNLDPHHKNVVAAYILGVWPENLDTKRVFVNLLNEFSKIGKTKTFLDALVERAPKPFLPFHGYETLLNGLTVPHKTDGVGGATNCMVREGVVLQSDRKNKAIVKTRCLGMNHVENKYVYEPCTAEVYYDMSFLKYVVVDKELHVAIHQGWIIDVLDDKTFKILSDRNVQTVKLFEKFGL